MVREPRNQSSSRRSRIWFRNFGSEMLLGESPLRGARAPGAIGVGLVQCGVKEGLLGVPGMTSPSPRTAI